MKKVLLIVVVTLLGLGNVSAQEVKLGAKLGLNLSSLRSDMDFDSKIGFNLGVFAEINLSDKLIFQPELLYSTQGASLEESFDSNSFKATNSVDYLNIPLMLKYGVTDKLFLEFGPQLGFLLSAKSKFEETFDGESISEEEDIKEFFKSIDFGLNFGASFDVAENIMIGARYNLGLTNIIDEEDSGDDKVQNAVFSLSLGYRF
jgi:long-subunit fatty acid transport protein